MNIQRQLSNGSWIDVDAEQVDGYLDAVITKAIYPVQTREQVVELLSTKKAIYHGSDWYLQIRMKPAPRQPVQVVEIKCDCGHTVAKNLVMNANFGTSCPDCYDRMSE
jgi:hypothetical protein